MRIFIPERQLVAEVCGTNKITNNNNNNTLGFILFVML